MTWLSQAGPHPLAGGGPRVLLEVRVACEFLRKTYNTKIAEYPQFSAGRSRQIRSGTLPWGLAGTTSSRGRSAPVVLGPIGLTIDREL